MIYLIALTSLSLSSLFCVLQMMMQYRLGKYKLAIATGVAVGTCLGLMLSIALQWVIEGIR